MPTPSLDGLRLDDLRMLLEVVRHGTLSAAAAVLGTTASTVGRRIDALEAATGLTLFDRSPDGARATAAADELMPIAESLEQAAADVARVAMGFEAEPEGEVVVTGPPGVIDCFVAPALPRLYRKHPRIRVRLDASVGYLDLTRRQADIALRPLRDESGDLVTVQLVSTRPVALGGRAHVRRAGCVRSLSELTWLTWGPDLDHLPESRWLAAHVEPERVVLRSGSIHALIAAARAGLGAVLLAPDFAAATGLCRYHFAPALARTLEPPASSLYMVSLRALRHVPRVAAVWESLAGAFAGGRRR